MKTLLIYYTGTYNTRYISNLIKKELEKNLHEVDLIEINENTSNIDFGQYDYVGIGYPIYAFNVPSYFLKFLRKQKFSNSPKYFIYKNSGETLQANDTSSLSLVRLLRKYKIRVENEYHFIMPYNIHFRFEDELIHEMLEMDEKLVKILVKEVDEDIPNKKKYKLVFKVVTQILKVQYMGGYVNSFFYKVDKKKCVDCSLCINECPTHNIYKKKDKIKFHHHCNMCMRCSFYCPKNAIKIGLFDSWRVNGKYDYDKIKKMDVNKKIITKDTKGFFKCYIKTYNYIDNRYNELFCK